MIQRRGFLAGLGALLASPAIIRTPGLLMPVKVVTFAGNEMIPVVSWCVPEFTTDGEDCNISLNLWRGATCRCMYGRRLNMEASPNGQG